MCFELAVAFPYLRGVNLRDFEYFFCYSSFTFPIPRTCVFVCVCVCVCVLQDTTAWVITVDTVAPTLGRECLSVTRGPRSSSHEMNSHTLRMLTQLYTSVHWCVCVCLNMYFSLTLSLSLSLSLSSGRGRGRGRGSSAYPSGPSSYPTGNIIYIYIRIYVYTYIRI